MTRDNPTTNRENIESFFKNTSQLLAEANSHSRVQEIVRTAARRLCEADGAAFVLRDQDQCFYVDEDAISPLWKGQRFPIVNCISGWAMLNRQSTSIPNIFEDSRVPVDAYRPTFVRSLLMVPINRADPIGAIGIYWADQHVTTQDQVDIVERLAEVTFDAIVRVGLESIPEDPLPQEIRSSLAEQESSSQSATAHTKLESVLSQEDLARDLHDTVLQRIFATLIILQDAKSQNIDEELESKLNTCVHHLNTAIRELRGVIFGLEYGHKILGQRHNKVLGLAAEFARLSGIVPSVNVEFNLELLDEGSFDDLVSVTRELLSNVARHAHADECTMSIYVVEDHMCLEITDNGRGFSSDHEIGNGHRNARTRAQAHSGSFEVSTRDGSGTRSLWRIRVTF